MILSVDAVPVPVLGRAAVSVTASGSGFTTSTREKPSPVVGALVVVAGNVVVVVEVEEVATVL